MLGAMKGFVFRLIPPRPTFPLDMSDDEKATMLEHAEYWAGLAREGSVVAFGPVNDPAGPYGIGIVLTDSQSDAERIRDNDPAMISPHGFSAEIAPMISLVTPSGRYDA
jgi:hypothetical protein